MNREGQTLDIAIPDWAPHAFIGGLSKILDWLGTAYPGAYYNLEYDEDRHPMLAIYQKLNGQETLIGRVRGRAFPISI